MYGINSKSRNSRPRKGELRDGGSSMASRKSRKKNAVLSSSSDVRYIGSGVADFFFLHDFASHVSDQRVSIIRAAFYHREFR